MAYKSNFMKELSNGKPVTADTAATGNFKSKFMQSGQNLSVDVSAYAPKKMDTSNLDYTSALTVQNDIAQLTTSAAPTTPISDEPKGKTFLQKLGDILNFNQNMDAASSAMAIGKLIGNEKLEQTGKDLANTTEQNYLDSSKEFGYIAERGASGAAKGVEGFVNALGYLGQMNNRNLQQQNAETLAAWGALTGNQGFKGAAEHMGNTLKEDKENGLQDTVSFGSKYQQNVQDKYADADITKTGQFVGNVSEAIGGILPSAAANAVIPGSGIVVTALSAGGNAAQEAKANGASDHEALLYGTAVGGIEAATEKVFDGMAGIFGKGAADDVVESIAKKLAKSEATQGAFIKIANSLGEGFEEFLSEFGQRVANELVIDTDNRSFLKTLGDAGTSAIMGAVVGGVIQASNSIVQGVKADPSSLAQQAASAAVGQINTQTAENPQNQPATPTNDVTPTTAPSEQKTAPNAVNGAEAVDVENGVAPATGEATAVSQLRSAGSEGSVPPANTVTNENENVNALADFLFNHRDGDNGWGQQNPNTIGMIYEAITSVSPEINRVVSEEVNRLEGRKEPGRVVSPVLDAITAVSEDVRQDAATPAQAIFYLINKYESGGADALASIVNHSTGNLTDEALAELKSQDTESVGAAPSGYGQNTVGSAQAQFKYQEAPTQNVNLNMFTDEELKAHPELRTKHQVYTNAQSRFDAETMLANEYESEVERLKEEPWGAAEQTESHIILTDLVDKARETGDWSKAIEWYKLDSQKGATDIGQSLQARRQFANSAVSMAAEAANVLDGDNIRRMKPEKKQEILNNIFKQGKALEDISKGDTDSLIALIERNNEIRKTTGLFSKKTAKQMDWALHKVVEMSPDTAEQFLRNVAVAQIRNIASDYNKVGVTEAAKSVRITNMLSKISAVMRNLVSNNIFDPLEAISGDVGVIADLIMSKMTGQRTTTIDRSWTSKAKRAGTLEGALKSYIEVGLDAPAQDATSRYEGSGSGRTFKMTGNPLERLLSTWSKYENYALQTTDEAQKGGIRAEAQRQIDSLKASGKLKDDALKDWANETARQRTFQNDSKLAKAATGLRSAANYFHVGDIGAGDILLPFAKVPANLVSQSANYSPLGLVNDMRQVVEVMIDAKRGTLDAEKQAQVARNFGRGVTGTALLAGFAALAAKGLIDVAGADDEDKEALEKAQGKTGTQWNLSATLRALNGGDATWKDDDLLMSIGFLDPLNSIMAAGSLLADDLEESGYQFGDVTKASLGGVWQAVLDLPAMSSVSDLINSYKYAEGETDAEKLIAAGLDYAGSQLASFVVPNALRGVATGFDDTVRNQYTAESVGEATLDSIKSGIPGLRETLPASLDPFGREKTQTGNTLLNFMNNNVLPGSFTKYSETTVEKVLEDLYSVTGEAGIYPDRKAPNSFSVDKEKITLDADDKDQFMKVAGSTAESLMDDLVKSDTFTSASKEEQAAYLKLANEYARAMAKYDLTNGKYESEKYVELAQEAQKDLGLSEAEYLLYYMKYGGTIMNGDAIREAYDMGIEVEDYAKFAAGKSKYDADGNSSYTNAENLKAVEESGFTGEALTALYMITFPDWVNSAAKKGVDFMRYVEYKKITNGLESDKKANGEAISGSLKKKKIAALIAAGYNSVQANQMYKEME